MAVGFELDGAPAPLSGRPPDRGCARSTRARQAPGSVSDGAREGRVVASRPTPRSRSPRSAAARVRELEAAGRTGWRRPTGSSRSARRACAPSSTPDPTRVALVGCDGTFLDLNPPVSGCSSHLARRLATLRSRCWPPTPQRTACRALASQVFRGESATRRARDPGPARPPALGRAHATPLRDADGRVTSFVCVARDMTARKGRGTGAARQRGALARRLRRRR